MNEQVLEGIDAIYASMVFAASSIVDEYCKQHDWIEMAETHNDKWLNLRDSVIEEMSKSALKVLKNYLKNTYN